MAIPLFVSISQTDATLLTVKRVSSANAGEIRIKHYGRSPKIRSDFRSTLCSEISLVRPMYEAYRHRREFSKDALWLEWANVGLEFTTIRLKTKLLNR